ENSNKNQSKIFDFCFTQELKFIHEYLTSKYGARTRRRQWRSRLRVCVPASGSECHNLFVICRLHNNLYRFPKKAYMTTP
ncbi:hypothetical protein LHL20_20830, partial [Alteromonas sp. McT4-15]|uniref:hypothetical protein n=1 Tax=Alteromonas sp. McT4-15 TaxID=2881256 RepID=UPI001CF8FF34